jgi:hypothetical protein
MLLQAQPTGTIVAQNLSAQTFSTPSAIFTRTGHVRFTSGLVPAPDVFRTGPEQREMIQSSHRPNVAVHPRPLRMLPFSEIIGVNWRMSAKVAEKERWDVWPRSPRS